MMELQKAGAYEQRIRLFLMIESNSFTPLLPRPHRLGYKANRREGIIPGIMYDTSDKGWPVP